MFFLLGSNTTISSPSLMKAVNRKLKIFYLCMYPKYFTTEIVIHISITRVHDPDDCLKVQFSWSKSQFLSLLWKLFKLPEY